MQWQLDSLSLILLEATSLRVNGCALQTFYVYILLCSDRSYYTGHTDDLETRLGEHASGKYDGYTKSRRPLQLEWSLDFATRIEALGAEQQIKGWTRKKKEALMKGTLILYTN